MYLHGVVGVVLLFSALFGIIEGLTPSARLRLVAPLSVGVGGVVVLLYVGAHHWGHGTGENESADAAHWLIGALLLILGALVAYGRTRLPPTPAFELGAPFVSVAVGALFLVHSGGAGPELMLHISIAATLGLSALAHFSVILSGEESRALRLFAALLLAVGGMQLVIYDAHPLDSTVLRDGHNEH